MALYQNPKEQSKFDALFSQATSHGEEHYREFLTKCTKNLKERIKREVNVRKMTSGGDFLESFEQAEDKSGKLDNKEGELEEDGNEDEEQEITEGSGTKKDIVVTDAQLAAMWTEIDNIDVSTFDRESTKVFDYQGFNPDEVLRSLIINQRKNKVSAADFKSDILLMCSLAIIKGSINEHNFKKLSTEGQSTVIRLEKTYGIKRGSGRSEPANVVTISRIGATFPGKIIQLLVENKASSRKFMGPFKSHTLPQFIRHQGFAAVIPTTLAESTRMFLLDIVTAYSVDQSISISPNKKDKPDLASLYEKQRGFIQTTADNKYPSEIVRKKIFTTIMIDYDSLLTTARALLKVIPDFTIVTKENFVSDINSTHI
uniref:Nucleoprotein n=1 Tax=Citrus virus A TaxID=2484986 RepID=A0A5J6ED04_9VIRU|nr:nucleocapsid [Citrus virus A]